SHARAARPGRRMDGVDRRPLGPPPRPAAPARRQIGTGRGLTTRTVRAVIEVRPATVDDVPAMLDILAAVAAERIWIGMEPPIDRPLRIRQFTATIEGEGAVLVATAAETVIGQLWLHGTSGLGHVGMAVS